MLRTIKSLQKNIRRQKKHQMWKALTRRGYSAKAARTLIDRKCVRIEGGAA